MSKARIPVPSPFEAPKDPPGHLDNCVRKVRHETFAAAEAVIDRMRGQGWAVDRLSAYLCDVCHRFHIGKRRHNFGNPNSPQEESLAPNP